MPTSDVINKPLTYCRAGIAKGLKAGQKSVDRKGGDYGAGVIRGIAVVTRGEALGHRMWIDSEFVDQTVGEINAGQAGVKARFTHPGLSADGLGTFLGRVKNATRDGDVARADLHFSPAAHESPDGDLADYVMLLAESDPEAFGESIVFEHDLEAEKQFESEHKADEGKGDFQSPDPDNVNNYRHARLAKLRAVDTVDSPAANPKGLFHRSQEIAEEAEALLSYATGLTSEAPALSALDLDPDRVSGFVQKFLDRHGLELKKKDEERQDEHPDKDEDDEDPERDENQEDDEPEGDEDEDENADRASKSKKSAASASPDGDPARDRDGKAFLEAFGEKGGVWFAEGKRFDEAQALYVESLRAENEDLKKRIGSSLGAAGGEAEPVSFSNGETEGGRGPDRQRAKLSTAIGANMARFASGLKFRETN